MKGLKLLAALVSALLYLPPLVFGQQQSTSAPSDPIERFLGKWDLHTNEAPGVPERESLTLERTENGVKITHLVAFENNDTVLHYWGVMDPKGLFVQMRQTDGKPMNEQWRIVSVDSSTLVIETRPFGGTKKYQLSADGQSMKMTRLTVAVLPGTPLPDFVFQKSK